jgi:hypothetical protein
MSLYTRKDVVGLLEQIAQVARSVPVVTIPVMDTPLQNKTPFVANPTFFDGCLKEALLSCPHVYLSDVQAVDHRQVWRDSSNDEFNLLFQQKDIDSLPPLLIGLRSNSPGLMEAWDSMISSGMECSSLYPWPTLEKAVQLKKLRNHEEALKRVPGGRKIRKSMQFLSNTASVGGSLVTVKFFPEKYYDLVADAIQVLESKQMVDSEVQRLLPPIRREMEKAYGKQKPAFRRTELYDIIRRNAPARYVNLLKDLVADDPYLRNIQWNSMLGRLDQWPTQQASLLSSHSQFLLREGLLQKSDLGAVGHSSFEAELNGMMLRNVLFSKIRYGEVAELRRDLQFRRNMRSIYSAPSREKATERLHEHLGWVFDELMKTEFPAKIGIVKSYERWWRTLSKLRTKRFAIPVVLTATGAFLLQLWLQANLPNRPPSLIQPALEAAEAIGYASEILIIASELAVDRRHARQVAAFKSLFTTGFLKP